VLSATIPPRHVVGRVGPILFAAACHELSWALDRSAITWQWPGRSLPRSGPFHVSAAPAGVADVVSLPGEIALFAKLPPNTPVITGKKA
jgi:hypothetical protein